MSSRGGLAFSRGMSRGRGEGGGSFRGGAGRGFRGGAGYRGGRGRGASGHQPPSQMSKAPAFPVVGGAGPSSSPTSSTSSPPSSFARGQGSSDRGRQFRGGGRGGGASSDSPARSRPRVADEEDADDEDRAPAAVSARRAGNDEDAEEEMVVVTRGGYSGQRGSARLDGRGGGRGVGWGGRGAGSAPASSNTAWRGGSDGGRGRGGRGGFQSAPQRVATHTPSTTAAAAPPETAEKDTATSASAGPTKMITMVTESGTELPKKLPNRVFIDGLPYKYEEPGKPSLEDELIQFALAWKVGKPIRLIKKPGQGFGFLVFQSPNSVPTAVRVLNGRKFLGRALRVAEPKPKDLEKAGDVDGMRDVGKDSFQRQVLLTDLAKISQPEIIREVLRDVAPQLEKKLEAIKMTSNNRKAFLTFEAESDVDPAVKFLDGFHLLGRKIGAARAAAPGSLPYSRTPLARGAGTAAGTASLSGADAAQVDGAVATGKTAAPVPKADDDDDLAIIPLGAEGPASIFSKTRGKAAQASAPVVAAAASAPDTRSNVTGKTEKYDLLDKGPAEVYVGNLSEEITADQLRQHLSPSGRIVECELLVHPQTHLSTGIARVQFALPAYAAYAQEHYHGSRLRGCVLRVDRGESPSAPLAVELPPPEEEDDYDEAGFLRRYGVKDPKKFFKDTSVAHEMNLGEDSEPKKGKAVRGKRPRGANDDDEDGDLATGKGGDSAASSRGKRQKAEDAVPAGSSKKGGDGKGKKSSATPSSRRGGAEDDGDLGFVVSGTLNGEDDSDEEHFYDVDEVAVPATHSTASGNSSKSNKNKNKKGALAKKGKK